jgi:hypothetical protein
VSAACVADILFLEALGDLRGETTIVLPYGREQFEEDSVAIVPDSTWPARYRGALDHAAAVVVASERRMGSGPLSYEYANLLIDGLAALRGDALDTEVVRSCCGTARGDGRGGTAATVGSGAGPAGVEVIDLPARSLGDLGSGILGSELPKAQSPKPKAQGPKPKAQSPKPNLQPPSSAFEPRIVTMLFADAKGFSKLAEPQIPAFVHRFLGAVAQQQSLASRPPS